VSDPDIEDMRYPTVDDCIQWLANKWARHRELEDKAAGEHLAALRERVAEADALLGETLDYCMDLDLTAKIMKWRESTGPSAGTTQQEGK
jgi:hypothetical protein